MTIELRDYQQKIIDDLRSALKRHKQVLLQLSTGGGKTMIMSFMVKNAAEKGNTVIFCVHRRELIKQVSNTFIKVGIPHGFIASGLKYEPYKTVYIASIDTLRNRLDSITPPDLLIFDEAHRSASESWSKIADWTSGFIIGMTATPWRLDGTGLKKHYGEMIRGPEMKWLIDNGYLARYKAFAPSMINLTGVRESLGEYASEDLERLLNDRRLFGKVVDTWTQYAQGKKTIAFCSSVNISKNLVQQFNYRGISALHLDALSKKGDRNQAIQDFADGKITVLSNVSLFTEGFDLSASIGRDVPIEAVIVYRPTLSVSLHLQMLGRALRKQENHAIILDHGGNILRHGLPDDDYQWTLEDKPKDESKEPPVKECPECHHIMPAHCKECPECKYVFPEKEKKPVKEALLEMVEIDQEEHRRKKHMEVTKARTLEELQAIGVARGYKPAWAKIVWEKKRWKN